MILLVPAAEGEQGQTVRVDLARARLLQRVGAARPASQAYAAILDRAYP